MIREPQNNWRKRHLTLLGCGNMGGALLKGWIAGGFPKQNITVVDPQNGHRAAEIGVPEDGIHRVLPDGAARDIMVLAIKPQLLHAAAQDLRAQINGQTLLLSVMAGVSCDRLQALLPDAGAIVRAMPNLPASISRSATVLYAKPDCPAEARLSAELLFSCVGTSYWLDGEAQMHAATAIAGSGSAYVFLFAEYLATAGVALGLPDQLAMGLALDTVSAAAEMAHLSAEPPSALREQVTSPAGTTAAAMEVLTAPETGLLDLLSAATAAAAQRSRDLAE